ncbi:hypothetical protein VTK73DRAFT_6432 [Phialemonium thermophilum]|uniref:F-box domain-containing protein n=1 Tax=Phialemonium thermophilum TaxID=223376 RepID=A0ABR3WJD1_9PEZI
MPVLSKLLKERSEELRLPSERKRPLNLLELPVDILRLIVKEMTHTNDLTALALTNSTFHNLAVPHIYSRFDIVWPDGLIPPSDSKSVDALTYGLSTLCLGSLFARTTRRFFYPTLPPLSRFDGNDYAKYTRKFSLGNGPKDWVSEYMITKESGKMLGTLVAIAVAKMVNLETFVWDMPTGVLSDVFMALSSLPEHHENNECKLERVWIRWHDNGENASSSSSASLFEPSSTVVPVGSTLTPVGILLPPSSAPTARPRVSYSEHHVEYPTFSVLPPLKSLTVLEIDELAYLDEMADLIARSKDRLQELRVGISVAASQKDFVKPWDGPHLHQVDHAARWPGESTIGDKRLGGVLGVLVGKIYDIRRRGPSKGKEKVAADQSTLSDTASSSTHSTSPEDANGDAGASVGSANLDDRPTGSSTSRSANASGAKKHLGIPGSRSHSTSLSPVRRKKLEGKLKLHTLELERIPLSMQVCRHAIDWSVLTNLTILDCAQHENLWKMLKRQFQPTQGFGISVNQPVSTAPLQYHLALKHIHTDVTSAALISFIKETLEPNTLEVLFLQDRRKVSGPPAVTIDQIFKGAIKRHRTSLRKLLLDSSIKGSTPGQSAANGTTDNVRWRNWMLTSDIVLYITSGRMSSLRELAASLSYKDWHTFLQRLPNIPQLQSLNIPYVADYTAGTLEPKELALQIIDVITLRPEIQLCYVGISAKCFEVLESRPNEQGSSSASSTNGGSSASEASGVAPHADGNVDAAADSTDDENAEDEETSEEEDDEEEETEDEDVGDDANTPTSPTEPDETQSETSDADDSDDDSFVEPDASTRVQLRLREILFYDDKVAIFKARHGRL